MTLKPTRKNPLLNLTLVILFGLALLISADGRADAAAFFDSTFGDFSEELQTARDDGKKAILIMFEMDECPFCHRMKQTVLNRPEVQEYFREHFMILRVDVEGDIEIVDFNGDTTTEKDFAFKQNRVRATPVFAFFDLAGQPIKRARFTGATNGPDEFMLFGQYMVEGAYNETSFTRYKRDRKDG